ncbi:restriction endonuclease [Arenimonas sp.]|uniref:restriction endonuclease n=1 Tax=Arenimonas sp. TaxID=1872635 RepID=UPI0039E42789
MVRGEGGTLYDEFREKGVAAIGWWQLAPHAKPGVTRKQLAAHFAQAEPGFKSGSIISGASQVWRFVNEIEVGDHVLTYSPANRTYLIGVVKGATELHMEWKDEGMSLVRPVEWNAQEVQRDALSMSTKNSLGSTLTVFKVPATAAKEILAGPKPSAPASNDAHADTDANETAIDIEEQAREQIKDMVASLEPREMEQLVAGILRAMGFKTRVSPIGPDRGKDIIASPDGFGFRDPRIVVEVKHRSGQMGSPALRSFLGGRHPGDRGLYVSTGGFSKDALYEAERAQVPMTLWTLDDLVRALVEHYDQTDAETKRMVPLKRVYWPA